MTLSCLLATEPTDAALLRDSAENPEAFGVLYDRYARQLLAFVYRRTACPQTAADVVAETSPRPSWPAKGSPTWV